MSRIDAIHGLTAQGVLALALLLAPLCFGAGVAMADAREHDEELARVVGLPENTRLLGLLPIGKPR